MALLFSSKVLPPKVVIQDNQYAHSPATARPRLPVPLILVSSSSRASRFQVPASCSSTGFVAPASASMVSLNQKTSGLQSTGRP